MRWLMPVACAALSCGMLQWYSCSPDSLGGGTSTSENGRVAGIVVDSAGVPATRTQVELFPADFDPVRNNDTVHVDTTDDSGNYLFTGVEQGTYTVSCVHLSVRTRAFRSGIEVHGDTVKLSGDTLRKPGSIEIALPDTVDTVSGYMYIPGTGISVGLSGARGAYVVLDSVPAGDIPAIAYASTASAHSSVLQEGITVLPEDTARVLNTGWKYNRRLRLNTTPSGAGVAQDVHDFPVLVRLHEDRFDFTQAGEGGIDLRFTRPDGTALAHEIGRWDDATKTAEVWLRIDTLRGNDMTEVVMYWGNGRAGMEEIAPAFDTSAGFGAVWHLDESNDTLHDATANRCHGTRYGTVTASPGTIGDAQRFEGEGARIEMGNVLDPGDRDVTVSAWVRRSNTGLQTIMAKSNGGDPDSAYGWSFSFGEEDQLQFFAASAGNSWGSDGSFDFRSREDAVVKDSTAWHHVAAVFDRSGAARCRVYIDGVDVTGSSKGDVATVSALTNGLPLRIGAEADDDYQWTGNLDECSISYVARPEAWIRLCFVNQRPDDRLVEFP